jgi:dGTPase
MGEKKFSRVATIEGNPKWEQSIYRIKGLYRRENDIRSEFLRDYNRILHCTAYRRLKHKTQVFFATGNDHICTRIEHVNHVSSVSYTIANYLGLNTELTNAIAIGHDLGHSPFGHEGEKILERYVTARLNNKFWHEKNSLKFVDSIETLTDPDGKEQNLNLTYAVRDGIICHCGEVKSSAIFPRLEIIDLSEIQEVGQVSPFTWEGCIVKIADKISYLGRDIEDAFTLKILNRTQLRELHSIVKSTLGVNDIREINNTVLMHNFMIDLCENSNPDMGIVFSGKYLEFIDLVKDFNYKNIYYHKRLTKFKKYAELVINTIIETLEEFYDGDKTLANIRKQQKTYPVLAESFESWLSKYSVCVNNDKKLQNDKIYDLDDENSYIQAIVDYISGMTDNYAIKIFNEIIKF